MSNSRRYVLFGVTAIAMLVSGLQNTMVSVALPEMVRSLNAPLHLVGWVITIFSLSSAAATPVFGKLSDELGRRRVFVGGLSVFGIASLVCGFAPNVYVLIAARVVQGLAGGSILPSTYGVVADTFPESRARAVGMIATVGSMGMVISPSLGGVIVEHFGWRWTFLSTVPLVAMAVVLMLLLMPASKGTSARRIDFAGMGLIGGAMLGLLYALNELGRNDVPPNAMIVGASFVIGVVCAIAFIRHELRTEFPLIDMQLMRRREVAIMNALNFLYGVGIFPGLSFLPLYAREQYGFSATQSGALLTPRALTSIVASPICAWLLPRTGYRKPVVFALGLMAVALFLFAQGWSSPSILGMEISTFVWVSLLVGLTGIAFGVGDPAANNSALELAPNSIAAITGLRSMFRQIGVSVGSAIMVFCASRASSPAAGTARFTRP